MSKAEIPVFENTNDLHEATGFSHRSHIPNFDVFAVEDMGVTARRCMPPYRQSFYQIGLLNYTGDSRLNLDTDDLELKEYPLWFVVPGQVFSWVRDERMAGLYVMFRKEFLINSFPDINKDFPFLKMTEKSVMMLTREEHESLNFDIERMLSVFKSPHPYQEKMLEGMLSSLLYFCKAIYERHKTTENHLSRSQIIANRFEALVDKMYVDTKNVSDYAQELNITPNYLTTTIKKLTGKSAKDIIQERLLMESKSLLKYSGLDIAEIAYRLNFQEPTHFTRFFKNMSGTTPNQYRRT
ncbi:helix-turn-helix domain-containing protein [Robertkochia solimangrovi]|uniref:helix-turn-helix domain-containing protein n=1 Tax=Robertkochia solimangrovi TaxID=2213046 RepID=UPI0011815592|nr:helix-turn-helix domain-containing protein [Robertkochia solimangrovi]TRZ41613.1 AraC family transcriptional regulator [Robertkochia solimangrovi]